MLRNIIKFAGVSNQAYGVVVTSMPAIPAPLERGEAISIPGRSGDVWRGEGAYEAVQISVTLWVPPEADLAAVRGWLSGEGKLYIGSDPYYWRARVSAVTAYTPCVFNDGWTATVTFECMPFRHADGGIFTVTTNPYTVGNIFTAFAEPLIEINLTADAEISFCGTEFALTGLTGTVYVDCELQECYTADGVANDHMTGPFPVIPPGDSEISWTGGVSSMTVTPRWRTL